MTDQLSRRTFAKLAGAAALGASSVPLVFCAEKPEPAFRLGELPVRVELAPAFLDSLNRVKARSSTEREKRECQVTENREAVRTAPYWG